MEQDAQGIAGTKNNNQHHTEATQKTYEREFIFESESEPARHDTRTVESNNQLQVPAKIFVIHLKKGGTKTERASPDEWDSVGFPI